jgi:hypothetical protein
MIGKFPNIFDQRAEKKFTGVRRREERQKERERRGEKREGIFP